MHQHVVLLEGIPTCRLNKLVYSCCPPECRNSQDWTILFARNEFADSKGLTNLPRLNSQLNTVCWTRQHTHSQSNLYCFFGMAYRIEEFCCISAWVFHQNVASAGMFHVPFSDIIDATLANHTKGKAYKMCFKELEIETSMMTQASSCEVWFATSSVVYSVVIPSPVE